MKAILINSTERTVTEVDYDGNFRNLQKLIGCDCFTIAPLNPKMVTEDVSLYVDDEGLLTNPQAFFQIKGVTYHPLAGNGVILGTNEEGESVDSPVSVQDIAKLTKFYDRATVALGARMGVWG